MITLSHPRGRKAGTENPMMLALYKFPLKKQQNISGCALHTVESMTLLKFPSSSSARWPFHIALKTLMIFMHTLHVD
jgi:hypothetical protein